MTERDAATSLRRRWASSAQIAPTYWLNPGNGVSYPVAIQTPQYDMDTLGALKNIASVGVPIESQLLGGLATIAPEPEDAIVTHYNIRPR